MPDMTAPAAAPEGTSTDAAMTLAGLNAKSGGATKEPAKSEGKPEAKTDAKTDAKPDAKTTSKPAVPAPRKWEPYEYEDEDEVDAEGKPKKYRFETEHDFKKHVSKGNGAQRKFDEAAKVRKEWSERQQTLQAFEKAFQTNPAAAMRKYAKELGISEEQLREAFTHDDTEARALADLEKQDPEKAQLYRIARQQKERLDAIEAEKAQADERQKNDDFERKVGDAQKRFDADTDAAMKEFGDYDKDAAEDLRPIVQNVMRVARQGGYRLAPKAAAEEARRMVGAFVEGHIARVNDEGFQRVASARLGKMPVDAVEKMLGEQRVMELAQRAAERVRGKSRPVTSVRTHEKPLEEKQALEKGWGARPGDVPYGRRSSQG